MNLFTEEWREAGKRLSGPLRPYHKSSDMGASCYTKDGRFVTIKNRLRKDNVAVVSLGCGVETGDGTYDYPDIKWFTTTAIPQGDQADVVSQALLAFLEKGQVPILNLSTYPGYENLAL